MRVYGDQLLLQLLIFLFKLLQDVVYLLFVYLLSPDVPSAGALSATHRVHLLAYSAASPRLTGPDRNELALSTTAFTGEKVRLFQMKLLLLQHFVPKRVLVVGKEVLVEGC